MFVPLYDDNPLRRISHAYVTWALIALNGLFFVLIATGTGEYAVASFALIPNELFRVGILGGPALGPNDLWPVPERYTLVTYMFLHGDLAHLIGNMLFLWVFGDNVEDALGHLRFAFYFIACGVVGGLVHAVMQPTSGVPLIGASGAVAGVVVGYLILYPQVRVWVLAFQILPLQITAAVALGLWVASQFAMLVTPYLVEGAKIGPVSWWAHIGGMFAGVILIYVMRRAAPSDTP